MKRILIFSIIIISFVFPDGSALAEAAPVQTSFPITISNSITKVDATTMKGKLLMGYQGWFSCPGDGEDAGWGHWFNNDIPDASHFRVDMWPDASELTLSERCKTQMQYPDGTPAYLYSANNADTVKRHFQWMNQYGIDGVFVQRFTEGLAQANIFSQTNKVVKNVLLGAETYGRVFALEYDVSNSNPDPDFVKKIENDWKYLVDVMKITDSPAYLHHKGRPVLAIYGLGNSRYPYTHAQAMELVNFFKNNADPRYRVTLVGGVPGGWRTLSEDSFTDREWADYYCALDVISPWTVGRYKTDEEVDFWSYRMKVDMEKAKKCKADYMPVVWPGTSFHNSENPGSTGIPFNSIPRRGGRFYWRQIYDAISIRAPMIFNAMFDEVDEDTAMYKIAATVNDQPKGVELVSMDADGEKLPNDWYLKLAGAATKMLREEIPLTPGIPINPDGSLIKNFKPIEPTPAAQIKIRVRVVTSADWTSLNLLSGGQVSWSVLISTKPEVISTSPYQMPIGLNQPLSKAQAGNQIEMLVDLNMKEMKTGIPLIFELQRGSIGKTTVTLMKMTTATPKIMKTVTWAGINDNVKNPYQFSVASELFLPSTN